MGQKIKTGIKIVLLCLLFSGVAAADPPYTSPNYQVNETFFGTGGDLNNQSAHYQARTAVGELAVGNISSPHFQAYAGFNTSDAILLELNVTGGEFDLGVLDQSQPKVQSTTFSIRDYLSTGYTVQVMGRPPSNSGHELTAIASATASTPGTEQFGVNLAANNISPIGPFGADPAQEPDTTFGFGYAVSPYDTGNLFKFQEGDTVARSDISTGTTVFTLSVLANVSRVTPGGSYGTSLFVRVIPTF